jgi:hypothetical protein
MLAAPSRTVEVVARTLYRGLSFGAHTPDEAREVMRNPHDFLNRSLNRQQLGIHWTANSNSAYNFATDRDPDGWAQESWGDDDEDEGQPLGVVMGGRVHPRHVLEEGSEEHESYSMGSAIFGADHPAQETTVRDQGRVHVNEMQFFHGSDYLGSVKGRWHGRA